MGVEIIERSQYTISYFLFSDEDLTEREFLEQIETSEHDFWDYFGDLVNRFAERKNNSNKKNSRKEALSSGQRHEQGTGSSGVTTDQYLESDIDLLGLLLKLGLRIPHFKVTEPEVIDALQNGISFSEVPAVDSDEVRRVFVTNYNQVIIGEHNTQNLNITDKQEEQD